MNKSFIVSLSLGLLMALTAILTRVVTPSTASASPNAKFSLESIIPREFDGWKPDPAAAALMVDPDSQGVLARIYNQTLSRIYVNSDGERVMLSIAYGGNQSTDMHVHRPEICYTSAGFDIGELSKTVVDTAIGRIPVMRLVARQGTRNEPITYWIRVGDSLTRGWIEQKLSAIVYGLSGTIPDGLLFRVSSISGDAQDSFRLQQTFLSELLRAMKPEDRYLLVGLLSPGATEN